jgi:hydroxymethylpyrimidine pyrophosphatase-like HAD family hydrolase
MKKKKELIELLEKVISIADSNLKYEMFDFEDFSYVIENYKDELEELED